MRKFLLPIIVVIAAVLYSSVVVVTEGTRGIMLRFNKVQRDAEKIGRASCRERVFRAV